MAQGNSGGLGVVFTDIKVFLIQVKDFFWPSTYFSWQTLLSLSLFSLLIAVLLEAFNGERYLFVDVLSTLSWIFFTSAVWWFVSDNKDWFKAYGFYFGPWVTGAVLCTFLFWPWEEHRFRWGISSWPMISMAIKALPNFVTWELKVKPPKSEQQQQLVMTLLVNLLINSWILFFFRVQDWVTNYPSLLANDLSRSAFVYDFVSDRQPQVQGVLLVENTAEAIAAELEGQPWYQTERWLYKRKDNLEAIAARMTNTLSSPIEQTFWQMAVPQPKRLGEGYLLTLRADWTGPVARDEDFYVEKSCKILPVERPRLRATGEASSDQPAGSAGSASSEEEQLAQTSKLTVVDCGEDLPAVKRIRPSA